nr:MAG TPA: hypothetical protein [Caudoviricetes sp.]
MQYRMGRVRLHLLSPPTISKPVYEISCLRSPFRIAV